MPLTHGWLPDLIQLIAVGVLIWAIGRRTRRWLLVSVPAGFALGAALALVSHWYVSTEGLSGNAAPWMLWVWVTLAGLALVVLALGWRGVSWWRRSASVFAVLLAVVSVGLQLNIWTGYFPTVQTAWHQITDGPLPDQVDLATVRRMQTTGEVPGKGVVVKAEIPDTASGFKHRDEYVYLPPAWFATNPSPRLPVIMMIGAEFQNASDWIRIGDAVTTADQLAAGHGGNAPVMVFADATGAFNNDSECVNGPRGNAADHLTKDVVPYVNSTFGTSPDAKNWGIAGFSMGGTCAITLSVMHPELFSAFVDIAGDLGPNAGDKQQTIERLFGGDAAAFDRFDPTTAMTEHGAYHGMSAWFPNPGNETGPAKALCDVAKKNGIECSVSVLPGRHDWPFAAKAFAEALPWLAGQLGTPQVPRIPLPRTAR